MNTDTPTPRTDAIADSTWQEGEVVSADFARQLERELSEITKSWQEQTVERRRLEKERDKLRAKNDSLESKRVPQYDLELRDAAEACSELQKERDAAREQLKDLRQERDQLRAENDRLRKELNERNS